MFKDILFQQIEEGDFRFTVKLQNDTFVDLNCFDMYYPEAIIYTNKWYWGFICYLEDDTSYKSQEFTFEITTKDLDDVLIFDGLYLSGINVYYDEDIPLISQFVDYDWESLFPMVLNLVPLVILGKLLKALNKGL